MKNAAASGGHPGEIRAAPKFPPREIERQRGAPRLKVTRSVPYVWGRAATVFSDGGDGCGCGSGSEFMPGVGGGVLLGVLASVMVAICLIY